MTYHEWRPCWGGPVRACPQEVVQTGGTSKFPPLSGPIFLSPRSQLAKTCRLTNATYKEGMNFKPRMWLQKHQDLHPNNDSGARLTQGAWVLKNFGGYPIFSVAISAGNWTQTGTFGTKRGLRRMSRMLEVFLIRSDQCALCRLTTWLDVEQGQMKTGVHPRRDPWPAQYVQKDRS